MISRQTLHWGAARYRPRRPQGFRQRRSWASDAHNAGLVVGARVPVILTSRAHTVAARRFSAAAAVIYADALGRDPTILAPELAE